jgi:hypothetical protein
VNKLVARIAAGSIALLVASSAQAQSRDYGPSLIGFRKNQSLMVFNWEPSKPVGSFEDYISDWSWRGFSMEGRRKIRQDLSVGASWSWNRWDQTYDNLTVTIPGGAVTGPLYRYTDQFALRALFHYYFLDGAIQPYAGFGIGGVWSFAFQQVTDLGDSQDGFHFIVDPEIGALVQLMGTRSGGLNLNVAFRYTFTTADPGRVGETHTISPILGLAWHY